MKLTINFKSPSDTYQWIEDFNALELKNQYIIKNQILNNQYPQFIHHLFNVAKYQLTNKFNELLQIFKKDEVQVFFEKFGLELTNKIFWSNSQNILNTFFINHLENCKNKDDILKQYENNKKVLFYFYELSKLVINDCSNINDLINYLNAFNNETRLSLLLYNFDFPNNKLYKQNIIMALISLHQNFKLDEVFKDPDLLSNTNKQMILSHYDENNNSLISVASQYNNLGALVFLLSNLEDDSIKKNLITKKFEIFDTNKIFKNNGLSPIHTSILNNNLDIFKYLLSGFNAKEKFELITSHKTEEYAINFSELNIFEIIINQQNTNFINFILTDTAFFYRNNLLSLIKTSFIKNLDEIIKHPFSSFIIFLFSKNIFNINKNDTLHFDDKFLEFYNNEIKEINNEIDELNFFVNKNDNILVTIDTIIKEICFYQKNDNKSEEEVLNFKSFLRQNLNFITNDEKKISELLDEIIDDLNNDSIEYVNYIYENFSKFFINYNVQNLNLTKIQENPKTNNLNNKNKLLIKIYSLINQKFEAILLFEKANKSFFCQPKVKQNPKKQDPVVFFIDFNNINSSNLTACRSSESMESLSNICSDNNLDAETSKYKMGQIIEPFIELFKNNYIKLNNKHLSLNKQLTKLSALILRKESSFNENIEQLNSQYNSRMIVKKHC